MRQIGWPRDRTPFVLFLVAFLAGASITSVCARQFTLGGVTLDLTEVTTNVDVYFTAMRFNRAANEWDVDVTVSNKSTQAISGPVILMVDSYMGTTGPLRADGVSSNQFFYDLGSQISQGMLSVANKSGPRTIGMGFTAGAAPKLATRVYAASANQTLKALGFARSLNEVGQPLPGVNIQETGPDGNSTNATEGTFGVVTLGQAAGNYVWKFSLGGYLSVWRQALLRSNSVVVVPYPRLTARNPQIFTLSPLSGGTVSNQTMQVQFGGGIVSQSTSAQLTGLDGQTLPAFLPQGWSPLQAFWLELGAEPSQPATAALIPWSLISSTENATLVKFDSTTLTWQVLQVVPGNGTNALGVSLPGTGAYALVVPDASPIAPPSATVGSALQTSTVSAPNPANLVAGGTVTPATSPASAVPGLVTATADVVVTNVAGRLASGTLLRSEVSQQYQLQNGTSRTPPIFDNFIVGYQRPGDAQSGTLHARFPLRPVLLFGPQQLNQAVVHVDLFAPSAFSGGILDTNGGEVASASVRLLAGQDVFPGRQAIQLRSLSPTNFTDLAGTNLPVLAAFEVAFSGTAPGRELVLQASGLPTNTTFVLARVIDQTGLYGVEPRARLHSDANGILVSDEPASGDRLPGLTGAGQCVLMQVQPQQGLVEGVAKNSGGQPTGGLPVSIAGQPWLTFSAADGSFKLLAPAGSGTVSVTDLATGDAGTQAITVPANLAPVNTTVASVVSGLRVASITPTDTATNVPQVTSVTINFSRPLNPATLVSNALQLLGVSNRPVAATFSLNLANTTATLLPNAPLDPAAPFKVVLSTNITDSLGRTLAGQNQFTFTTVALSARDPAAQLIIYEPGATNVPRNVVAQIPGYVPGTNKNAIVVRGTPGVADPGVAVILANESSGETATVLSKPDGSFTSVIEGTEADFVSATFVNLNNTRVYVPVSRQLFDNGFVGLYRQGGILEAQSDGGPVQVFIQPEAVPTRTKFRLKTVTAAQLKQELGGVEPESATVAGGAMHIEVEGQPSSGPMQVSFPVDLEKLGYPTNQSPTDAVLALTVVRDTQGVKTFEVLDQMVFRPKSSPRSRTVHAQDAGAFAGTILAVSGFVPGAVGLVPLIYDWIIVPTLMLGTKPVVVTGQTYYFQVGDPKLGQSLISKQQLSGTFVVLQPLNGPAIGAPGRLQPGWVYASSGADGSYKMIAPFAGIDYRLQATHPLFEDSDSAVVANLLHTGGAVRDFIFKNPLTSQLTPRVVIANAPQFPAAGQACEVQVNATQALGGPPQVEVEVLSVSRTNLLTGLVETNAQAVLTGTNSVGSGNNTLWSGTLTANKPIKVVLNVKVQGKQSLRPIEFPILFAGPPPPPTNNVIPPPDTNDVHGPLVIATQPAESGFVDASGTIAIFFNKPIDTYVNDHLDGVLLTESSTPVTPVVRLSPDQQVLVLQYPGLEPNQSYRLTLSGTSIRDLGGKLLDQRPSTPAADTFTMTFRTAPVVTADLPGLVNGRGSVISGNRLYVLDQAQPDNYLAAYDITNPSHPKFLSKTRLLGAPRDLVVIPQYRYVLSTHSPAVTNDLVVVVGGDLDTTVLDSQSAPFVRGHGQYLTVVNMGEPASPEILASPIVSLRVGSAVTKVRWAPPYLIYEEFGADIQQLVFVHLQELLIGFGSTRAQQEVFPPGGKPGVDLNGDGDYVDPGEILPLPSSTAEFFGKRQSLVLQHSTQKILDFSVSSGGNIVGVTLKGGLQLDNSGRPTGQALPPAYRTFAFNNQALDLSNPTNATLPFGPNVYPRWVTILNSLQVVSNGVPQILPVLALVSLTPDSDNVQRLAVIDISLPLRPRLIGKIPIPESLLGGFMQSVTLRSDRLLAVAGTQNLVLLDPSFLLVTNVPTGQLHPAIVGSIPVAGGSTRSLGSTDYGVYAVADGGRGKIVQTPPTLSFVSFPNSDSVVDPITLHLKNDATLAELVQTLRSASAISPARVGTNFDIRSDLNPPNPALHFHVLMSAPGGSGFTIELGLESVNLAGRPLANQGQGFAPVRAVTDSTQQKLGQMPRPNCGAPIRSLTAYRMSDYPNSPFYNRYLSRPFALIYEQISLDQLEKLKTQMDREIIFSSSALRAFIDPTEQLFNSVIGKFAAQIDDSKKLIYPISSITAFTLNQSYIMGNNPPPSGGSVKLPGTHGTVSAHNGELRMEATDMVLPSPRMPIEIQRAIGDQDTYEGPFGVGWDFNYNQRLTELESQLFPAGLQMPLIVRANKADSELAGSQDVLFHTGLGGTVIFKWVDTHMPPEYVNDPLVQDFKYRDAVSDYYLPEKRQGVFDLLVKFKDGRFERLTSEGMRYRYALGGRLEMIIDRFPGNHHDLEYDHNGWLTRIDDRSVSARRFLELGYFRRISDSGFNSDIDVQTENSFLEGKICRLRDYAGGDVLFQYSAEGFLTNRLDRQVNGENGGFAGRAQTSYLYNGCQLVGVSATANGTPIFSAVSGASSTGKPVVQSGNSVSGAVQVTVPLENSAAKLQNQMSTATLADGSTTQFQFDKWGHPMSATVSGGAGAPTTTVMSNNEDGLVIFVKYPEGNSKSVTYDSENAVFRSRGNMLSVTVDPGPRGGVGYTETYQYDRRYSLRSGDQTDGNAFIATYRLAPDGREINSILHGAAGAETFGYNDAGQLNSSKDLQGITTTITYDSATGFIKTRSVGDSTYTYSYGGDYASQLGRTAVVALPEGAPIQTKYNGNLQPVEIKRGALVEAFAYDEQSQVTYHQQQMGDGKALTTRSAFDENGFLKTNIIAGLEVNGQSTSLEYVFTPDTRSRIQTIRHPQGTLQKYAYDNRGNLTNITFGNYVEQYAVDLNNNVTAVTQGANLVNTTVYDGLDRPVTITRKTGAQEYTETLTYHPKGQLKSRKLNDAQFGVVHEQTYDQIDPLGRPLNLIVTGKTFSPTYQFVYAPGSYTVTGPRMSTTRTWNAAGFDTGFTDPILTTVLHPDGRGRVKQAERREDGATFNDFFTYDDLDHRTSAADDLGTLFNYLSRAEGSLLAVSNALGHATTFDHSALGEVLSRRRADGMEFRFQHDPERFPSYTGDPSAGFHFGYDENLRLTNSSLRNGAATIYAGFDSRNMPQTATIPGGSVTMRYDLQRRLTDKTVTFQSTSYEWHRTYDALNRVRMVTYKQDGEVLNTASYDYDTAGPLLSARFQENGDDFTVQYTYYEDQTRKTVAYPSGVTVTEQRDTRGRLTGVTDANGTIIRATAWQGNMRPKTVDLGPAINIANRYDARGRLTASRATRAANGTVLTHMRYQYDAANNLQIRQFLQRGGKADNFGYDLGERLSRAKIGTLPTTAPGFSPPLYERSYSFDPGGLDYLTSVSTTNLGLSPPAFASQWTSHDAFLQPTLVDNFTRGPPDPVGNVQNAQLQVRPDAGSSSAPVSASLTHNGNGSLIRIARSDGIVEENFYQPGGLRYARRVSQGGQTLDFRHFVYDDIGRLLEEYDRTGATPRLIARYYYATADAPEAADLRDPASGTLRRYYFLKDLSQSVIALADANGNVLERVWYDPHGQPVIEARDVTAPGLRRVIGGDAGSLLIVLSEPVQSLVADPGPGSGLVRFDPKFDGVLTLTSTNASAVGTLNLLPSLAGFAPYSVFLFSPTQSVAGPVTLTLNAGTLADEWGNSNAAQTVSLQITGQVGTVYYSAQPDLQTGPQPLARSSVGSPFLFHGQYFDYESGLIYLRARFYDPFSGMFLEPDPLGYEDSVNFYAGMRNNPVGVRDPTGLGIFEGLVKLGSAAKAEGTIAAEVVSGTELTENLVTAANKLASVSRVADEVAHGREIFLGINTALKDANDIKYGVAKAEALKFGEYTIEAGAARRTAQLAEQGRTGVKVEQFMNDTKSYLPRVKAAAQEAAGGKTLINVNVEGFAGREVYEKVASAILRGFKGYLNEANYLKIEGKAMSESLRDLGKSQIFIESSEPLKLPFDRAFRLAEAAGTKTIQTGLGGNFSTAAEYSRTDIEMYLLYKEGALKHVRFVEGLIGETPLQNPFTSLIP